MVTNRFLFKNYHGPFHKFKKCNIQDDFETRSHATSFTNISSFVLNALLEVALHSYNDNFVLPTQNQVSDLRLL